MKPKFVILPLFLFGMLVTSCIDNNYDLSEIDTDGVVIGDEFRLPLATVTVSMSELGKDGTDIKALFDEADIWLPSPLPADGKYVDLQKIQHTPSYIDELLDELIEQMKRSDAKINAVADLLYDKYLGTFLPLLPPNTDPKDFKQVFITMFRATTGLQEKLAGEVRDLAGGYLTDLKIEDVTYDLGRIDLGSDVVDMLADNLDPKFSRNSEAFKGQKMSKPLKQKQEEIIKSTDQRNHEHSRAHDSQDHGDAHGSENKAR